MAIIAIMSNCGKRRHLPLTPLKNPKLNKHTFAELQRAGPQPNFTADYADARKAKASLRGRRKIAGEAESAEHEESEISGKFGFSALIRVHQRQIFFLVIIEVLTFAHLLYTYKFSESHAAIERLQWSGR
jgi:hypothetical protein